MAPLTGLFFCIGFAVAYGSNCDDVSGIWRNELGSRMMLRVDNSNRISGEYYTAVESRPGSAAYVSNVTGIFSKQSDGAVVAFSVLFNNGFSLTTWVGQCMVCDGQEVLHTTYTLRKYTADHREKWTATVTNQNTFQRLELESENDIESLTTNFSPVSSLSTVTNPPPGGLELNGKWKSHDTEEIEFFGTNKAILEGKHHTTDLVGRKDGNEMFTAVTFMTTSSKRIKSWTGHIYDMSSSTHKILETTWLEHEFNPSCSDGRSSVKFAVQSFTRISPALSQSPTLEPPPCDPSICVLPECYCSPDGSRIPVDQDFEPTKLPQMIMTTFNEFESMVEKPETFLDKLRKFFTWF